jgi:hypothetical protein
VRRCGGGQQVSDITTAYCEDLLGRMEKSEGQCGTRVLCSRRIVECQRNGAPAVAYIAHGLAFERRHSFSQLFSPSTPAQPHPQHGDLAVCIHVIASLRALLTHHRWYRAITPKTRVFIGVGVMAYAGMGLFLSDKAEEKFGLTPTEKDMEELREALPKISTVDRKDR